MRRSRGFTLLEMLVAVALLALLGVAAALTLNSTLRGERLVGAGQQKLQALERAHRIIRRDLEQMVDRRGREVIGDPETATRQGAQESPSLLISFFRTGRRILTSDPPSSHLERVRYRLRGDELWREASWLPDPAGDSVWSARRLLTGVRRVQIRYFHQQRWIDQWPPVGGTSGGATSEADVGLPAAIEVTLELERYGALPLRVLLPGGSV